MSPSSPPLPPFFCLRFYFRATAPARKCSLIRYHQEANWGRTFMRSQGNSIFITKILSYHKLWHYSTTKQGKQAANSFISFNTLASPGGGGGSLAATFFWPTKLSKDGCGGVTVRQGACRPFCEEL